MRKRNILLLHGWGATSEKLNPLGEELEGLGFRIFIPRIPGFATPEPKEVWGVDDYASYIRKITDKFFSNRKYIVFGHSFGGRVAIKMALKNDNLQGIVLCSTSGISRSNILKRSVFYILAKVGKILLLMTSLASFYRKILYKLAREHDYERTQGIMKDVFKKVISENLRDDIKDIKIPVLVVWGKNDRMTPVNDAYYIKNIIKKSEIRIFDNEGHTLPYRRYQDIAVEIDRWSMTFI